MRFQVHGRRGASPTGPRCRNPNASALESSSRRISVESLSDDAGNVAPIRNGRPRPARRRGIQPTGDAIWPFHRVCAASACVIPAWSWRR